MLFDSMGRKQVFMSAFKYVYTTKRVRVWSIEILLLNKNRQNFNRPIYMQVCIFYLFTVRWQENKVFSAPFTAENTRFSNAAMKLKQQQRKKVTP
jgi:hypothetical protein